MHESLMQEALRLANKGRYTSAPNPMVGCVITKHGQIIGRGWHEKPGTPHAEVHALKQAGKLAINSTVYVTLEPCSHTGRTPPCAEALIQAKVNTVYIAIKDPNPLVAGKGITQLLKAGITVHEGLCEQEAKQLNEVFFHYITTKRPYVIAKWAMTLDGKLATNHNDSKWITQPEARTHVHQTRHASDAILIGSNTARTDNPLLTARHLKNVSPTEQPLRVVLNHSGDLSLDLQLFSKHAPAKTLLVSTQPLTLEKKLALKKNGHDSLLIPANERGVVDIPQLLDSLSQREISSLYVEGGATIHTSFFEAGVVNKIHVYIAPKLIGGKNALTPLIGQGIPWMAQAKQLHWDTIEKVGNDLCLFAYCERKDV